MPKVGVRPGGAPRSTTAALAAEVEDESGALAVEVQALYRGVVVGTRHLCDPSGRSTHRQASVLVGAGAAALVAAMVAFMAAVDDVAGEKVGYANHLAAGRQAGSFRWKPRSVASDVIVPGGIGLGLALVYAGLARRATRRNPDYVIGAVADADAPVAPEYVSGPSFALVAATGANFTTNVTPAMTGEVAIDGQRTALRQFVERQGASFSLPDRAMARIQCGESLFLVRSTPRPRVLKVPLFTWKRDEQACTAGTGVGLSLFLLVIFSIPPDPKALSLDLFDADSRLVSVLVKPPEIAESEPPRGQREKGPDARGGAGRRHQGETGAMGKNTSRSKAGLHAVKGPKDNPDPHLAKQQAEERAEERAKTAGILGVLRAAEGSHLASIFGRETARGSNAEDVLGHLIGPRIGQAQGAGGLGVTGTGAGSSGTGESTTGLADLGTIGRRGADGSGPGYGRGVARLGPRRARTPEVLPGVTTVRGSLDKEIVRRIIRRHINEVKYCYEQELVKKPDLGGRVLVQFVIAPTGQVASSVLQQSTLGSPRAETCIVQAVRRWEFPAPPGGGIVIVAYPFVLNPAGGATE